VATQQSEPQSWKIKLVLVSFFCKHIWLRIPMLAKGKPPIPSLWSMQVHAESLLMIPPEECWVRDTQEANFCKPLTGHLRGTCKPLTLARIHKNEKLVSGHKSGYAVLPLWVRAAYPIPRYYWSKTRLWAGTSGNIKHTRTHARTHARAHTHTHKRW